MICFIMFKHVKYDSPHHMQNSNIKNMTFITSYKKIEYTIE